MVAKGTLHVTPGYAAAGTLAEAIGRAEADTEAIGCPDDLSCGPITSYAARADWWEAQCPDDDLRKDPEEDLGKDFASFWDRIKATDERLIVWFSRYSSAEYAFFLAVVDQLGERPYNIIDVTGTQYPVAGRDGFLTWSEPPRAVSCIWPPGLRALLGSERPLTANEKSEARRTWQRLRAENAHFRVVSETGLNSAPADHFDPLIMERVTTEWQKSARVIGYTMGHNQADMQVGDFMLLTRLVALIGRGKIQVESDPWNMQASRLRLPPQ